jgi:serine beta-lactamase-like protein LACTB, mitochondrial
MHAPPNFEPSALRFVAALSFLSRRLALALSSVPAATQDATFSAAKRAQIEESISAFMTTNSVSGISVAVLQNGRPLWSAGFGMSDLEDSAPATSYTLYRRGSISNSSLLSPSCNSMNGASSISNAPVQKYCPAFPQKDSPITSRQLLAHLAGIRHYIAESLLQITLGLPDKK